VVVVSGGCKWWLQVVVVSGGCKWWLELKWWLQAGAHSQVRGARLLQSLEWIITTRNGGRLDGRFSAAITNLPPIGIPIIFLIPRRLIDAVRREPWLMLV